MKKATRVWNSLVMLAAALTLAVIGLLPPQARAQNLTDYGETTIVNHWFRATPFTAPATWYLRLNTSACSDSASGTEVSGGSYARGSIASGTSTFAATSGGNGQTSNSVSITFPTPSAGWGTVSSMEWMDASTSGNSYICTTLTTSKTINTGDTVTFPIGSATVTFQ